MKNHYPIKNIFLSLVLFIAKGMMAQNPLSVTVLNQTVMCNNDASVTLGIEGGTEPFTIHFLKFGLNQQLDTVLTTNENPVNNLSAGYFIIHVYDANNLFGQSGVFIQASFMISAGVDPANCANSDGKIIATVNDNNHPFIFEWSTGQINVSDNNQDSLVNIPAGSYNLIVTNSLGCRSGIGQAGTSNPAGAGVNVWATSPITVSTSATPSNCFDGTATAVASNGTAPYSYYWNTNPVQTTATATGLAPGFYQVTVTDMEGCVTSAFRNVPAGPNFLQVNTTQSNTVCNQSTGFINANVSGGAPPYSYLWSNGAITNSISGLSFGSYQLTVTDSEGCSITVNKFIGNANPMHLSFNGSSPSCNSADGSVTLNISGGTAPFDIVWSNGQSNVSTIGGLPVGNVTVAVTDANGCVRNGFFHLPISSACLANISGRVVADHNEDCVQQGTEPGIAGVVVRAGVHHGVTQSNGNYQILVPPADYQVSQFPPAPFEQICPEDNEAISVNASLQATTYGDNNFFNGSPSIFSDVAVYIYSGPIRPGFQCVYYISVRNLGVTSANPTLSFNHDALLSYLNATPSANNYNAASRTASWNVGVLAPNQTKHYQVRLQVSLDALDFLGTDIPANAEVNLIGNTDAFPDNNTVTYFRTITGSYDPNDKQVFPKGITEQGLILASDTVLNYLIRFQNTGNDTAFTVVVRDTLDPNLDVSTLRILGYSHPMDFNLSGAGVMTFTFNNILLPDSNTNEALSHGYINYVIELKKDLPLSTQIKNTAYIYFDFNPPIITNTTINTIYDPLLGINKVDDFDFKVIPNPNDGQFMLNIDAKNNGLTLIEITDITGKHLLRRQLGILLEGEQMIGVHLPEKPKAGVYFIRLSSEEHTVVRKMVVR
jgi:hypothetical protein